jgi:hypothetical protein
MVGCLEPADDEYLPSGHDYEWEQADEGYRRKETPELGAKTGQQQGRQGYEGHHIADAPPIGHGRSE